MARRFGLVVLVCMASFCARADRAWADLPDVAQVWKFESVVASDLSAATSFDQSSPRHASVYSITQDRRGYLWLGTENGLNQYNGYGFKHFATNAQGGGSPVGHDISSVFLGSSGFLWVGTWGEGLDRFDPQTEIWTHYPAHGELPGFLRDDRVQTVFEDRLGTIWVGTFAGGLARFDRASETFTTYLHDPDDPSSLPHDRVWSITETTRRDQGESTLWVATSSGLAALDPKSEKFSLLATNPGDSTQLSHPVVRTLYVDRLDVLWVGTQEGLHRFHDWRQFRRSGSARLDQLIGPKISINTISEDRQGHFWVGTQDHGLYLLDRVTGNLRNFRHDPRDRNSISDNDVRALFEDRAENLWIGTRQGGLNRVDLKPRKFQHVTHRPDDPASLPHRIVRSLAEDAEGQLWVGTNDGLCRYDASRSQFICPDGLPGSDVHLLYVDSANQIWAGIKGHGLSRYLGVDQGFETFYHDPANPASLRGDIVTAMLEDRSGFFWLGTHQGLSRFQPGVGTLEHFERGDPSGGLADNLIWVLHEDAEGAIWVGTDSGGLHRINRRPGGEMGRIEHFEHRLDDPTSLSHNRVFAIHQPTYGRLWVGTAHGLNEVLRDGTFRRHQEKEGLPDAAVLAILSDARGRLWLSTHQGLSRFDPVTEEFRNYTVRDGLQPPEGWQEKIHQGQFLASVALQRRDGRLLFGGNNGFNCFHPNAVRDNPHIPPVVLTGVRRFGQADNIEMRSSSASHLELTHQDHFFELEFAALDFTSPEDNRYRYRLEKFDPDWIEAGNRRFASYTNVGPGDYVFRVQASNNDGAWNEEGLTLPIEVLSPWWATVWARLSGGLLVAALGIAIYRWQVSRHIQREQELERRVAASHSELRRSEARYRKLFERNLAGVVRATIDGRILDCNDAFARILGYGSREECRREYRLRFGQGEEGDQGAMLEQLRDQGSYESSARTREGSTVTLLWNANVVMDETSEGFVIEGTVIDISERQKIEERMRREQKLESLEVLAGGIAHDFNNLLVGILGNAELSRMNLSGDSPLRGHLDEIERAAHRAASLSKKMLAYSGKGRFVTTNLDLSSSIDEALHLIPLAKSIRVERHLVVGLPAIKADASQLHQLLSNLITNAAEAIGEKNEGLISVTTGSRHCDREYLAETFIDEDLAEGEYVFLEVRDNGSGIELEAQGKIFDPFFTTRFPGRGLGLPVVLGIVRGHRGALDISSEVGRGTVVQALFPASAEAISAPRREVIEDASWRGSGKVLIIDDEPVVREIATQMLQMLGFEVLAATDGDEGVEVYSRHGDEIVLVLLDLTMPRMSGDEAFSEIRKLRPDVRVILASGYEKHRATERFEGLAGFLQKPYQLAALREMIRRALTRPSARVN